MKRIKTKDGRTFNITMLVDAINDGTSALADIESRVPENVIRAIKKMLSKDHREAKQGTSLTGKISRRTDKAVLFHVVEGTHAGEESWFPLSQVNICERAMGPCDMLIVPDWLIKEKFSN